MPEAVSTELACVPRIVLRPRAQLARPLRVVALGGGTGLPVVLRALARHVRPRRGRRQVGVTGARRVLVANLRALRVVPIEADLLRTGRHLRHDPRKLGKALLSVVAGHC